MTYRLVVSENVREKIKKMDKLLGLMLAKDMKAKLYCLEDPRRFGKSLKGAYKGMWRYRIGAYRVICDIRVDELIALAIDLGHRKNIYELKRAINHKCGFSSFCVLIKKRTIKILVGFQILNKKKFT